MVFCRRVVSGPCLVPPSPDPYGLDSRPAIGRSLNGTMPETAPGISGNWSAVVAFPNLLVHQLRRPDLCAGHGRTCASGNAKAASGRLKMIRARRKKNLCSISATNARAGTIPACWAWRFIRVLRRITMFLSITPGSSPARWRAAQPPAHRPSAITMTGFHVSRWTRTAWRFRVPEPF